MGRVSQPCRNCGGQKPFGFVGRRVCSAACYIADTVEAAPNGCHLWTGASCKDGYGKASWNGVTIRAHRLAYATHTGNPGTLFVLYRCDTPACCNPAHLFLGTAADNAADRDAKERTCSGRRMSLARRQHPEKLRNTLRAERSKGAAQLSQTYGIPLRTIYDIWRETS